MSRITKKELQAKIYELEKDIHNLVRGNEQEKLEANIKWEMIYNINDINWYGDSDKLPVLFYLMELWIVLY